MKRPTRPKWLTAVVALVIAAPISLVIGEASAAPCPQNGGFPTCVTVVQNSPAEGATMSGIAQLSASATQNQAPRGAITHVEWWLYHPSFLTQNPNNNEGKVLLAERVNVPPVSGTLTNGTWTATWTVPAAGSSITARDGDYATPGIRTYSLPTTGQYRVETHVLDAQWDQDNPAPGGPPGRSGAKNVTIQWSGTPPPPTGTTATINGVSRPINGTNVPRGAGQLVMYTGTQSSANQWGYEVAVAGGRVTAVSAYRVGMTIPAGGFVLSGHDASADWLEANAPVGATVTSPAGGGSPPPPSDTDVRIGTASRLLNGTNVYRSTNMLVRYTGTARSPANQWGFEVSVNSAGTILARSAYAVGMVIPAGGSVLSGHDASADWLQANALVGSTVVWPGSNPNPPPTGEFATTGRWSTNTINMPHRAMHASLLRDGRVLLTAGSGNDPDAFAAGTFRAAIWNPTTNVIQTLTTPSDMFCSANVTLTDGSVLIQGGTASYAGVPQGEAFRGLKSSYTFDPVTDAYTRRNDTIEGHWYPTLTKLESGDVWGAGGYTDRVGGGPSTSTEMFSDTTKSWLTATQVPQTDRYWGTYPHMFLMADGRMLYTGGHTFGGQQPGTGASIYDWRNASVGDVPGLRDKELRDQAGSVLLAPAQNQRFMIAGGGSTDTGGMTNKVDIIDMNATSPAYVPGPDLPGPGRIYLNLTTLPDRSVLASNGSAGIRTGDVSAASIYNSVTNTWTSVAADPVPRNYHSGSLLLPDGRVAVFGSNPADGSYEFRISLYEPPYLFKGTRPTVTAPAAATYGQSFSLGVTGAATTASLTSPGNPTHQTDTNVRLVDLPMTGSGANRTAVVPTNRALLPPGPYMLTVSDDQGIPSVAKWITVS